MCGLWALILYSNIVKQLLILILLFSSHLHADIAVIGHADSELPSITKKEVKNIFMGRTQSLPNGSFALPIDNHKLRPDFYYALTKRSIEQVNAYWARIMFSGQASPPMKLPDTHAIIKIVSENKGAIGYIDAKEIDEQAIKVLLILKKTDKQ